MEHRLRLHWLLPRGNLSNRSDASRTQDQSTLGHTGPRTGVAICAGPEKHKKPIGVPPVSDVDRWRTFAVRDDKNGAAAHSPARHSRDQWMAPAGRRQTSPAPNCSIAINGLIRFLTSPVANARWMMSPPKTLPMDPITMAWSSERYRWATVRDFTATAS